MDSSPTKKVYKRRLRNYLIDVPFQLKYTGMVVAVTVLVASVLGALAYDYSRGQTESLAASIAAQPELDPEAAQNLEAFAAAKDQEVLCAIVLGILALAVALGLTGIVVTHRVVGPAYRMKRLFDKLGQGQFRVSGDLRKGDELRELYASLAQMVDALRTMQSSDAEALESALNDLKAGGSTDAVAAKLQNAVDAMRNRIL